MSKNRLFGDVLTNTRPGLYGLVQAVSVNDNMVQESAISTFEKIELPYHNPERWKILKRLYLQLETTQSERSFAVLLREIFQESGNEIEHLGRTSANCHCNNEESIWPFCGLQLFFETLATDSEKNKFFSSTLSFIAYLASSLLEFAPKDGMPLLSRQTGEQFFKFISIYE